MGESVPTYSAPVTTSQGLGVILKSHTHPTAYFLTLRTCLGSKASFLRPQDFRKGHVRFHSHPAAAAHGLPFWCGGPGPGRPPAPGPSFPSSPGNGKYPAHLGLILLICNMIIWKKTLQTPFPDVFFPFSNVRVSVAEEPAQRKAPWTQGKPFAFRNGCPNVSQLSPILLSSPSVSPAASLPFVLLTGHC